MMMIGILHPRTLSCYFTCALTPPQAVAALARAKLLLKVLRSLVSAACDV
jgi:hypothetical protein